MERTEFIKPTDLIVIENQSEFILRKGFIHINEIIIDKKKSSNNFINKFQSFVNNGSILIEMDEETYEDFLKLLKFGFLGIKSNDSFLVLSGFQNFDILKWISEDNIKVMNIDDFILHDDQLTICEDKNMKKLNQIKEDIKKKIEGYTHIYIVNEFSNITQLRALNRIFNLLNYEVTFGFIDNDNTYLTSIKPHYTGCYECLENHILSKFSGKVIDYETKYIKPETLGGSILNPNLLILMGFILKDMENIRKYRMSSLTGNIIHFYSPNFEYSYSVNLKNTACSVCAGLNRIRFEEQNIRSINVIKEVLEND